MKGNEEHSREVSKIPGPTYYDQHHEEGVLHDNSQVLGHFRHER